MTEDKESPTPSIDYHFPGQREGEEVKFILRRHTITMLPLVFIFFAFAFLPLAFYIFLSPYIFSALAQKPYSDIYFLMMTIYYGFLWIVILIEWLDYYLDIWIITDQRILEIEQNNLFHRVSSELDLKRVQDISSTVNGVWQTFFQYGDIKIQTASESNVTTPKSIPHPVMVRREIMELCKAAQEESGWGLHA